MNTINEMLKLIYLNVVIREKRFDEIKDSLPPIYNEALAYMISEDMKIFSILQ